MGWSCFRGKLTGQMDFPGKRQSSGDRNLRVRERSIAMDVTTLLGKRST